MAVNEEMKALLEQNGVTTSKSSGKYSVILNDKQSAKGAENSQNQQSIKETGNEKQSSINEGAITPKASSEVGAAELASGSEEQPKAIIQPKASTQAEISNSSNEIAKPKATTKPKKSSASTTSKSEKKLTADVKININKAMSEDLVKLTGIGESKAKAIIAYRDAHPFKSVDELMKVKGIGPKIFEKIKEHVEL